MRIIKEFNLFKENIDGLYDKFIRDIKKDCEKHNVEFILSKTKNVPYGETGYPVSGYFIDYGKPRLGVAIGCPDDMWIPILAHESSHMDQWIEKSPFWINSFIDGKEAVDHIELWVNGKEYNEEELNKIFNAAIDVELDCEKRTIEKIKKYNLPINIEIEIQKANCYPWLYIMIKRLRKMEKVSPLPREIWSKCPDIFIMDYNYIPPTIRDLYTKYAF